MLLPDNIHPENSIYYNGAIVLRVLNEYPPMKLIDLYGKVKDIKDISFPVFILCLDWLYLIDVAYLNKKGKVEVCS